MADLTRVAEVLRSVLPMDADPMWDATAQAAARELAAAGLVATETEWGTAHSSDLSEVVPERLETTARAKVDGWNRQTEREAREFGVGILMRRGVTPWRTADEGSED